MTFDVTVPDRDLEPVQLRGSQKCKCKCTAPPLEPGTETRAESGSLQLSPLGD